MKVEVCYNSQDKDGLCELGKHHLTEVLSFLSSTDACGNRSANNKICYDYGLSCRDLDEDAWRICYIITWGCRQNQSFVDCGGLEIAGTYIEQCRDDEVVITYVLWTLYNVSSTHPKCILVSPYLNQLLEVLRHPSQNISFLSSQILCNLLYKSSTDWCLDNPNMETAMDVMMEVMEQWKVIHFFNYNFFWYIIDRHDSIPVVSL